MKCYRAWTEQYSKRCSWSCANCLFWQASLGFQRTVPIGSQGCQGSLKFVGQLLWLLSFLAGCSLAKRRLFVFQHYLCPIWVSPQDLLQGCQPFLSCLTPTSALPAHSSSASSAAASFHRQATHSTTRPLSSFSGTSACFTRSCSMPSLSSQVKYYMRCVPRGSGLNFNWKTYCLELHFCEWTSDSSWFLCYSGGWAAAEGTSASIAGAVFDSVVGLKFCIGAPPIGDPSNTCAMSSCVADLLQIAYFQVCSRTRLASCWRVGLCWVGDQSNHWLSQGSSWLASWTSLRQASACGSCPAYYRSPLCYSPQMVLRTKLKPSKLL